MSRFIMDELVYGVSTPEATAYLLSIIQSFKTRGCDAVILGCTEIPSIVNDANSALSTLDSTRILARAALRYAANTSKKLKCSTGITNRF